MAFVCVDPKMKEWVKVEPLRTPVSIAVGVGSAARLNAELMPASPLSAVGTAEVYIISPARVKSPGLK